MKFDQPLDMFDDDTVSSILEEQDIDLDDNEDAVTVDDNESTDEDVEEESSDDDDVADTSVSSSYNPQEDEGVLELIHGLYQTFSTREFILHILRRFEHPHNPQAVSENHGVDEIELEIHVNLPGEEFDLSIEIEGDINQEDMDMT